MLRSVIIISSSGLVLFSQNYTQALKNPRMVGGVLRTMIEAAINATGMPVSSLTFGDANVHIASLPSCPVYCAILADRASHDGEVTLGRLVADATLETFVQEYGDVLNNTSGHNLRTFAKFGAKMQDILGLTLRKVLMDACDLTEKSILRAICVTETISGLCIAEDVYYSTADAVHGDSIVAALEPFLLSGKEILAGFGDEICELVIKGDTVKPEGMRNMPSADDNVFTNDVDIIAWRIGDTWTTFFVRGLDTDTSNVLRCYALTTVEVLHAMRFVHSGIFTPTQSQSLQITTENERYHVHQQLRNTEPISTAPLWELEDNHSTHIPNLPVFDDDLF